MRLAEVVRICNENAVLARPADVGNTVRRHWRAIAAIDAQAFKRYADKDQVEADSLMRAACAASAAGSAGLWQPVRSIIKMARIRAARIEDRVRAERRREWIEWLGCGAGDRRRLSKDAYRWIRGPTGWSRSPAGEAARNHDVPGDDEEVNTFDDGVSLDDATQGEMPLCDQAAVDLEAERWASEWAVERKYPTLPYDFIAGIMNFQLSLPVCCGRPLVPSP